MNALWTNKSVCVCVFECVCFSNADINHSKWQNVQNSFNIYLKRKKKLAHSSLKEFHISRRKTPSAYDNQYNKLNKWQSTLTIKTENVSLTKWRAIERERERATEKEADENGLIVLKIAKARSVKICVVYCISLQSQKKKRKHTELILRSRT